MSQKIVYRARKYVRVHLAIFADIKKLFGRAPLLTSEDEKQYNKLLLGLIETLMPADFIERLFVRQIADAEWEVRRYGLYASWNIERSFEELKEQRARRLRAKALAKLPRGKGATVSKNDPCVEEVRRMLQEADAILQQPATAHDHAEALSNGMKRAESFENVRNAAVARRDALFDQLARYQATLAKGKYGFQAPIYKAEVPGASHETEELIFGKALMELTGQPLPADFKPEDPTSASSGPAAASAQESETSLPTSIADQPNSVPATSESTPVISTSSGLPEVASRPGNSEMPPSSAAPADGYPNSEQSRAPQ